MSTTAAFIIAAAALLFYALEHPVARLVFFGLGGLALFDSGQSIAPKVAYMAACIGFAARVYPASAHLPTAARTHVRTICSAITAYCIFIWAVLTPVAVTYQGVATIDATRQALTQTLPAVGVLIGIDVGLNSRPRAVLAGTSTILAVGVIQYSLTWQARRGLSSETTYFLGSRNLVALAFVFSLIVALFRKGGVLIGSLGAITVAASAILSGNRSTITMLAAAPVLMWFAVRRPTAAIRGIVSLIVTFIGLAGFLRYILPTLPNSEIILQRLSTLLQLVFGDNSSDASARGRQEITSQALAAWREHPILGEGIGSTSRVDSAALYLLQFGLAGTIVIALFYMFILHRLRRVASLSSSARALILAWGVATLLSLVSSMPTADQGLSISMAILASVSFMSFVHGEEWVSGQESHNLGIKR